MEQSQIYRSLERASERANKREWVCVRETETDRQTEGQMQKDIEIETERDRETDKQI